IVTTSEVPTGSDRDAAKTAGTAAPSAMPIPTATSATSAATRPPSIVRYAAVAVPAAAAATHQAATAGTARPAAAPPAIRPIAAGGGSKGSANGAYGGIVGMLKGLGPRTAANSAAATPPRPVARRVRSRLANLDTCTPVRGVVSVLGDAGHGE